MILELILQGYLGNISFFIDTKLIYYDKGASVDSLVELLYDPEDGREEIYDLCIYEFRISL